MAAVLNKTLPPTTLADWERSDKYHNSHLLQNDETLEAALQNSEANGLPVISVSPAQGKFLYLLAKSIGAKRILEVGTLGGYSAIHFARALPDDGKVTTLELEERYAKVATENIKKAGVASKIQIIVGPALDSLQKMPSEPKFDFAFLDADGANCLNYFIESKRLVRKGGIIVRQFLRFFVFPAQAQAQYVDNVVRSGGVANPADNSEIPTGVRKLISALKGDDEVEATTISTVGEKGYDGFFVCYQEVEFGITEI
ncbi:O-methyltransferase family 3 protein [Desarmillaria tabescens]|uniref:O-methyltransferase family 3 protein n=1 Tax=Armillaria tabescens TaxID=1929756 RepID=A0AA39J9J3_ARMTA|nr:O-methyltransferase family 3 protein [Desarmillaria tabescens]KAK0437940.1 O-methyltransferase family 3 protein [Desarmillaria tabescens]